MQKPHDKFGSCDIIQKLCITQTEYGGIAQLGERLNGIQEVSGSIPLISTIEALKTIGFQGFFLCATLFPMAKLFLLTRICLQWRCVYSVQCVSSTWKAAANRCTASSLMESWT